VCLGFALCCKLSNNILVSFSRSGFINLKQGIRAFRLKKPAMPITVLASNYSAAAQSRGGSRVRRHGWEKSSKWLIKLNEMQRMKTARQEIR
jgi:hypothetical protein